MICPLVASAPAGGGKNPWSQLMRSCPGDPGDVTVELFPCRHLGTKGGMTSWSFPASWAIVVLSESLHDIWSHFRATGFSGEAKGFNIHRERKSISGDSKVMAPNTSCFFQLVMCFNTFWYMYFWNDDPIDRVFFTCSNAILWNDHPISRVFFYLLTPFTDIYGVINSSIELFYIC